MTPLKILYFGLMGASLLTLLFNLKKLNKTYYWYIPIIIISITVQVFGEVLNNYGVKNTDFIFHIFIPVEYSLLALFYHSLIVNKRVKNAILISILLLLIFSVSYYSANPQSFYGADFADFCIEAPFVCLWVTAFFIQLLKSEENVNLIRLPAFWINAGNLLFFAGCLVVMGLYFYLHEKDQTLAKQLLDINHYLNIVLYCMYIIAFICPVNWKKS